MRKKPRDEAFWVSFKFPRRGWDQRLTYFNRYSNIETRSCYSMISVSNWASKFLTLLWRIVTNPPVLQFHARVMLKDCPHGHLDGSPFKSFSYCRFIASRNSFFFSTKLYSSKGTAESLFNAPGSFASLTAWSSAGERNCSTAADLIFNFSSRFVFLLA